MIWLEDELRWSEDEQNYKTFYSTYYVKSRIIDRIKLYFQQLKYNPKH